MLESAMQTLRSRRGLTLLELVVVIMILAILSTLVVVLIGGTVDSSREQVTQATLREVQKVIVNRYQVDMAGSLQPADSPTLPQLQIARGMPGPNPQNPLPNSRELHPQLHFLFVNPMTGDSQSTFDPIFSRGWRGPYLVNAGSRYPGHDPNNDAALRGFGPTYGIPHSGTNVGDFAVLDGWGNPVILRGTGVLNQEMELVSAGSDGILGTPEIPGDDLRLPLQ